MIDQNETVVIKAGKKRSIEDFKRAKLIASLEASCLSVSLPAGMSKDSANSICQAVEKWLNGKNEVTSDDIRRIASKHLMKISAEAGYFYANYKQMF